MAEAGEGRRRQEPGCEQPEESGAPQQDGSAFETYQTVAETVGGVPSFRLLDNVVQGIIVLIGTVGGAVVGVALHPKGASNLEAALLGALIGLIASVILSGIVFMVVGWIRAARRIAGGGKTVTPPPQDT